MSSPSLIKYPYDPTGQSQYNRVVGEIISLPRGTRDRAYALAGGPFFANSVVLTAVPANTVLTKGVDYDLLYLYQEATKAVGQPVMAVVYVHNTAILGQVSVDYQVVGGEFSSNMTAIQALIESLQIDGRTIVWDDILNKPVTFPPAPHLHHVGDWYGMEAVVEALERLIEIFEVAGGGDVELTAIYQRLDSLDTQVLALSQSQTTMLSALNLLNDEVAALRLRVDNLSIVNKIDSPTELKVRQHNHFMASVQGTLPTVVGLPLNTMVTLSRSPINIEPQVTVFDRDTTVMRYGTVTGDTFRYQTKRALRAILVEPFVWEIS